MIARNNPITPLGEPAPGYFALGPVPDERRQPPRSCMLISRVWIVAILAVFMPLSIRLYNKLT